MILVIISVLMELTTGNILKLISNNLSLAMTMDDIVRNRDLLSGHKDITAEDLTDRSREVSLPIVEGIEIVATRKEVVVDRGASHLNVKSTLPVIGQVLALVPIRVHHLKETRKKGVPQQNLLPQIDLIGKNLVRVEVGTAHLRRGIKVLAHVAERQVLADLRANLQDTKRKKILNHILVKTKGREKCPHHHIRRRMLPNLH